MYIFTSLYFDSNINMSLHIIDLDDPKFCSCYTEPMFEHFYESEEKLDSKCIEILTKLEDIRGLCINFMVISSIELNVSEESLFLAAHIFDRALVLFHSDKELDYRMLALASFRLAVKYEENSNITSIDNFQYLMELWSPVDSPVSSCTCSAKELLGMELMICNGINYMLTVPTVFTFFSRFVRAGSCDVKTLELALGYCILAIKSIRLSPFRPSIIAASAVYLARRRNGYAVPWSVSLRFYTRLSICSMTEAVSSLEVSLASTSESAQKKIMMNGKLISNSC